jgi:hypothetical protein
MSDFPDEMTAITPMAQPFSPEERIDYEQQHAAFEWD